MLFWFWACEYQTYLPLMCPPHYNGVKGVLSSLAPLKTKTKTQRGASQVNVHELRGPFIFSFKWSPLIFKSLVRSLWQPEKNHRRLKRTTCSDQWTPPFMQFSAPTLIITLWPKTSVASCLLWAARWQVCCIGCVELGARQGEGGWCRTGSP